MEWKRTETSEKGYKKFPLPVGKDEVPSSNLGSRSTKPAVSVENGGFLFILRTFLYV